MAGHQKMYNIKGMPRPDDAKRSPGKIPYVPNLPLRYEISTLATSTDPVLKKQWTLFVLALDEFKSKPVEEKLSYFQVAGIHCYPEVAWDGAPAPRPDPVKEKPGDQPFGGYCNHNGLNFPTWHRPYMLLFEQRVGETMHEVIQHWVTVHKLDSSEEKKWREAADTWRLPYWDWAAKQTYTEDFACPEILVQGPVRIYPPKEAKKFYPPSGLYPNPFWSFENPEKDENDQPRPFGNMGEKLKQYNIKDHDGSPWSQATATSRYGITQTKDKKSFRGLNGVNNAWKVNQAMADMRKHWYNPRRRRVEKPGEAEEEEEDEEEDEEEYNRRKPFENPGFLADAVNRLFTPEYTNHWEHFASTKWYNEGSWETETGFLSLEYVHNNVHNIVGGSKIKEGVGHMSDVPVAAFDPIFWLHHCQIDRLLAIWQCLYPDRWWDASKITPPDPTRVPDDKETDELYPFHNKEFGDPAKDVWTAKLCRDWTELNYQYDDIWAISQTALKDKDHLDEDKFKVKLHEYIDTRYPHTGKFVSAIRRDSEVNTPAGLMPVDGHFKSDEDKEWSDYIVNVIYDRYALNGASYAIEFYLGGPSSQDKTVFNPNNLVGHVYNFGGGVRDSCYNCKAQESAGVLSRAQVPLTIPLLHHAVDNVNDHPLDNYVDDNVAEYLKLHLRWRFVRYGGEVVDASKFPKTQVKVLRGVGRPRQPQDLANSSNISMSVVNSFSALVTADAPAETHMPVYSRYVALPEATAGKSWGLQDSGPDGDRYY